MKGDFDDERDEDRPSIVDTASTPRRQLQVDPLMDGTELSPEETPTLPEYTWAPSRLKEFGGKMKNVSYEEMCQLTETLSYNLHQQTGGVIGPHVLAKAMFATVRDMDRLPGEDPEITAQKKEQEKNTTGYRRG